MAATRINPGKQTGLFIAQLGNWNLRQTAEKRFKVAAIDPVNGKANYAFGIKDTHIDTHVGLDCTKLLQDHPELYKSIEDLLKVQAQPPEEKPVEDDDPYGDLALSRRHKLSPEQNWRRGLLGMRRVEFERAAVATEGAWDAAIRMLWAATFGTKISEPDLDKAMQWITYRKGGVDLKELLRVERDYYAGKFAPHSSINLEAQLDMLAGANEFENLEEEENGLDTSSVGCGESGGEEAGTSDPASGQNDEADPLRAFR